MFFKRKPQDPPKPKLEIICPFCLTKTVSHNEVERCEKCKEELPIMYRRAAYATPPIDPFFLQVSGASQTGKTAYLYALTLMLKKMPRLWPGFYMNAVNDKTRTIVSEITQFEKTGVLPVPTSMGVRDAFIAQLNRLGDYADRSLVIRDVAGEVFNSFEYEVSSAPYFLHVPTTLMFFSLKDMDESGQTMDDLLNSYIQTLLAHRIDPRITRRNIVVVLSKADQLRGLPPNLRDYVTNDQLWADAIGSTAPSSFTQERVQRYISMLNNVSHAILNWLHLSEPSAAGFRAMAEANRINVRYTLVSSLGTDVEQLEDNTKIINTLSPRRVLDPFLWALELENQL